MKVHTTNFKEQIKELGRELDSIITFGDTALGVEELNAVTPSFQGGLLKSVMKQLDIDSNVDIPIGTELNYKFGVKVNDKYEYLDFGNYIVYSSERQEDTMSYKIVCYDKMLKSMVEYEDLALVFPITIRDYLNEIAQFMGLQFANLYDEFTNYNREIPSEIFLKNDGGTLNYTFRDVLDQLAQVVGGVICVNNYDELEVRYIKETNDTIDEEFLKDINVNFGEKFGPINSIVLSRSAESDNVYVQNKESIEANGLHELKIRDNQIMNFNDRSLYLEGLLNRLNGLEFYINDFVSTGICYYDLYDKYNVKIGDKTYSCIMFNNEILITQGLEENIYTEKPKETQTDYTKADKTDRKINQTYLIVDKQNQQIESVVNQTDKQNQKIAKVTQTVDELNSKISDLADITISQESNSGKLEFDKINQSEPIRVVIKPIAESISGLFPSSGLYPTNKFVEGSEGLVPSKTLTPSSTLKPITSRKDQDIIYPKTRTLRFHNKTTGENFDLVLPDDILYYDSENFDEFILDYDSLSCVINKKVGLNEDGSVYVLDVPKTIEYEYPHLEITDGDYVVTLIGHENAYLFVRLMAQNIYTTQFATKAELNSEIRQTANEINLEVSQKVNENEIISSLNNSIVKGEGIIELKTNSFIVDTDNLDISKDGTINAKNGSFTGTVNSTEGNIGGWNMDETGLSNGNYYIKKNGYSNVYTIADIFICQLMILGTLPKPESGNDAFKHYDVNGDGQINIQDMVLIQSMILGKI